MNAFVRALPAAVLLAGIAVIIVTSVTADSGDRALVQSWDLERRWIIHEKLPPSNSAQNVSHNFIYDPIAGATIPRKLMRDGQAHPAPSTSLQPDKGEPVHTPDGLTTSDSPAAAEGSASTSPSTIDPRRSFDDQARPDRRTEKEQRLDYRAVFDPSVVPFKRNHAMNAVTNTYNLVMKRGHIRQLKVIGNRVDPGREVFWGSVLINGTRGELVPLPSVSPGSQVLSYSATPKTELTFHKDAADNLYVRTAITGTIRLVFVLDASSGYFGRTLPTGARLRDIPSSLVQAVPPKVSRKGRKFAASLGIRPNGLVSETLQILTRHFRSFTPGKSPQTTGDIYLDLAQGKKGICRHRAFAFVVTALSLGIPARYVTNEAHVFVEVWLPGQDSGWLRIDLGGGADELVVHNAHDKTRHVQSAFDPFDRPPSFADQVTSGRVAGAENVQGLPPARRHSKSSGPAPASRDEPPETMASIAQPTKQPGDQDTVTTIALSRSMLFRGESIKIEGRVSDADGNPVTSGAIQIVLRNTKTKAPVALLGITQTDARSGKYSVQITLPTDQKPGNYDVAAQFMGGNGHAPSISD